LTASMGISIDLRKMAVYPIEVRTLFLVECLLRLLTGLEMLLLLTGLSLGMIVRNPRAVPVFLPALALFVMFNILLSAGLRQILERLLQRRGFRQFFLFVIVMSSALPQLMVWTGSGHRASQRVYRTFRLLPPSALPTTPLADAYLGRTAAWDWALLAAWCAAAGAFGFLQFRRSVYFDFAAARTAALRPRGRGVWAERLYRLPGLLLPDPVAALIERELRHWSRSPRVRFLFLIACSFGVVPPLPFAVRYRTAGPFQSSILTVVSLYGLLMLGQVIFMNSFGLDRSSARFFFWMPVSPSLLLLAKNLAGAVFVAALVAILALMCFLLRFRVGPWQVLEAFVVTAISALYLISAGNFLSVLVASGLSPDRLSRGGAGRSIQGLYVLLYPVLIFPVIAAYFAR